MAILNIDKDNFNAEIIKSDKPVLIDFWAEWCAPCKMIAPIVDELALENDGIKVCKLNVDAEPELATKFNIMNIPTLALVKNGVVQNMAVGVMPKERIKNVLNI